MMWQKAMIEIVQEFKRRGNAPKTITVETNATKTLTDALKTFINEEFVEDGGGRWHWAMSPKLWTVAGEKDAVKDEVIFSYCTDTFSTAIMKFVCNGSPDNWAELDEHVDRLQRLFGQNAYYSPDIWIMPVGATKDAQENTMVAEVAMEAMRRGYMVATRNHCYVFGNVIGK
jgi:hypothetical protein